MKVIRFSSREMDKIYNRNLYRKRRVEETVRKIVEDVRLFGDEALQKYTRRFDKVRLAPNKFRVTESETNAAYQNIDSEFISTMKFVMDNVTRFYKKQIKDSWKMRGADGIILGESLNPLEKVGIYVPSGTNPLVSSVYMTVLPAKVAGVKKIILATPPNKEGGVNPHILVVANMLKVDEVYKVGGAQAIASLAFGTKTIPKVDKIIGPGNPYVTEAKRQVFGYVDIDMIAGPSEVVIIANKFSNPQYIVADMMAQAEHAKGLSILITTSKDLARRLKAEPVKGLIIVAKNIDHAIEIANRIAPEHIEILVKNPRKILSKLKNAGAVFLGPYSPCAVGDYVAGPSHVLPTNGTARFFSGLSIGDFLRSTHFVSYSKRALEKVRSSVEKVSSLEGLTKHAESIRVRFREE